MLQEGLGDVGAGRVKKLDNIKDLMSDLHKDVLRIGTHDILEK